MRFRLIGCSADPSAEPDAGPRRPAGMHPLLLSAALAMPLALAACSTTTETRPATDPGAPDDSAWQWVGAPGITLEVPARWRAVASGSCEFDLPRWTPAADPCSGDAEGASVYAAATFDAATGPGLHCERADAASEPTAPRCAGYAIRGDRVVYVVATERATARRVLDSAQEVGDTGAG